MHSITDAMRLLQFGDSVLPVGSFSFSNGIEAAVQQRIVHDVASLRQFVETALHQSATSDGIALIDAHRAACAGDIQRIVRADRAVFERVTVAGVNPGLPLMMAAAIAACRRVCLND